MSIYTSMLDIERDEDKINIALEYTMDVNGQQMSECKVRIEICNQGKLELQRYIYKIIFKELYFINYICKLYFNSGIALNKVSWYNDRQIE